MTARELIMEAISDVSLTKQVSDMVANARSKFAAQVAERGQDFLDVWVPGPISVASRLAKFINSTYSRLDASEHDEGGVGAYVHVTLQ